jgi:phospholipase A1/A2
MFVSIRINAEASREAPTIRKIIFPIILGAFAQNILANPDPFTAEKLSDQVVKMMTSLTSDRRSALENRLRTEKLINDSSLGITFYKPTYILPYYYTGSPYNDIYRNNTPNNQNLSPSEFKFQWSLKLSFLKNLLGNNSSFNVAYTQISYWQFYVNSQYIRETNYEPEVFYSKQIIPNWWTNLGVVHQSNGRGGALERSWNRAYLNLIFSSEHWMVNLRPWILIFKKHSSDLHNPDISHYLGHGDIVLAYKIDGCTFSTTLRNTIGSGFKRPGVELDFSFPIYYTLKGYIQAFSGYGQSLLEYDHRTNSIGIGIALSDWI